jgi:hypothetical protein
VSTTGWSVALLVAGALIGSTIGVFLHRPLIDGVAWSVVLAAAASLAVVLLPPVQTVLRHLDHGSTRGVGILLVVAAVVAALAVVASSAVADRRS